MNFRYVYHSAACRPLKIIRHQTHRYSLTNKLLYLTIQEQGKVISTKLIDLFLRILVRLVSVTISPDLSSYHTSKWMHEAKPLTFFCRVWTLNAGLNTGLPCLLLTCLNCMLSFLQKLFSQTGQDKCMSTQWTCGVFHIYTGFYIPSRPSSLQFYFTPPPPAQVFPSSLNEISY